MKKKNVKPTPPAQLAPEDDLNDELRPSYKVDYSKSRPNRFAGRQKIILGASQERAGKSASRPAASENLIAKRVYLSPRQMKILQKIDKNISAAVRKLVDAHQK